MDAREKNALAILREALDCAHDDRSSFVHERCGDNAELERRVLGLLAIAEAESAAGDFRAADADDDPLLGDHLGPFRVIERIGRGGMGVVYRGEREEADFTQEAALKLIRRGFDFDDIRARFLRERRILARLDHPNLARFIDGGVATDGRPWFALEFVRGVPITAWCDARALGLSARVRLFLDVCTAVQYAHGQLVVHRDLKPANILVDGEGHVRLLDFGIARLLADEDNAAAPTAIGDRTAYTPEYAAPEQIDGGFAGVATDVYALGVVLYQLVTGVLPFELDRHDAAALQRALREQPPQPLVHAIARGGANAMAERLRARDCALRAYRSRVRGDLSRIVNKALAKDPAHRYASVQALAEDLTRWRAGAPVRVSGHAPGYRLRKFVGRNRVAVGFAALALSAIVAGLAIAVQQMHEARIQRNDALAAARRSDAIRDYLMLMFRDAAAQRDATQVNVRDVFRSGAARLFEEFAAQPEAGQVTALMLSDLFLQVADLDGASALLERLLAWPGLDAHPDVLAHARYNLAQILSAKGDAPRARELLDQAQAYWRNQPGAARLLLNESRVTQARLERAEGHAAKAIQTLREAVSERHALLGHDDAELGNQLNALALALIQIGEYDEAAARASESQRVFAALGRGDSDGALAALGTRCAAAMMLGRFAECAEPFKQIADKTRALYGDSIKLAAALNNLGVALTRLERYGEALPHLEQAHRIAVAESGDRSPVAVATRISLAELYALLGRPADAAPLATAALDIAQTDYAANKTLQAQAFRAQAHAHLAARRKADARADFARATALFAATGRSGEAYIRLMAPLKEKLDAP